MPKMIELIRQSAVPANVMRSAARGALTLPAPEMIEILVYMAGNSIFADQAKMTLAGWDETSSIQAAADPGTPWEVLTYFIAPENLRPKLLPVLLENRSVREAAILELAQKSSREILEVLLRSSRVRNSAAVLHALLSNPALTEEEIARVNTSLKALGEETQRIEAYKESEEHEKTQWEIEHAAEIAAEEAESKPFVLFGQEQEAENLEELQAVAPVEESGDGTGAAAAVVAEQEPPPEGEPAPAMAAPAATAGPAAAPAPAAEIAAATAVPAKSEDKVQERVTTLQKVARMGVSQRIQLAMKGTKEERFILVRDGSKLVSEAVLQSPKVTDAEIETFAGMKNVQEGVLRSIARNHKYMKNYGVVRALTNNPRSPIDLSLGLLNHLLANDLKALTTNKNIPETLRKLALKRFREKTEKR